MKEKKISNSQTDINLEPLNIIFRIAIIVVTLAPVIINLVMMFQRWSTAEGLTNSDWLNFWGAYVSGALGIFFTLLVFLATYIQNEKQHNQTREAMKEQNRLQVLPFLNVTLEAINYSHMEITTKKWFIFSKHGVFVTDKTSGDHLFSKIENGNTDDHYYVTLSNIGLGPLCNCEIVYASMSKRIGGLAANENQSFFFSLPELLSTEHDSQIKFKFCDILGNEYYQAFKRIKAGEETQITVESFTVQSQEKTYLFS